MLLLLLLRRRRRRMHEIEMGRDGHVAVLSVHEVRVQQLRLDELIESERPERHVVVVVVVCTCSLEKQSPHHDRAVKKRKEW